MTELLTKIIEAHGGLKRWNGFSKVEATIVTDGALWGMKNLTQDQDPRRMTVWLHEERSSVAPFGDPDWHTDFTPGRIAILRSDNTVVAERDDPRVSFAGHGADALGSASQGLFQRLRTMDLSDDAFPAHDRRRSGRRG